MQGLIRKAVALLLMCAAVTTGAQTDDTLEVLRGHSAIINMNFDVASIAMGDSGVAKATPLTPRRIIVNGARVGATSLMIFGKKDELFEQRIQVVHDLRIIRRHLARIDKRIQIETDINRDALVLTGTVKTEQMRARALDAVNSYLSNTTRTTVEVKPLGLNRTGPADAGSASATSDEGEANVEAPPGAAPQTGGTTQGAGRAGQQVRGLTDATAFIRTQTEQANDAPQLIDLLESEENLVGNAQKLERLLTDIDARLKVEQRNGVFIITGKVDTPAKFTRALTVADTFVSGGGLQIGQFRVIADRGGVIERTGIGGRLGVGGAAGGGGTGAGTTGTGAGTGQTALNTNGQLLSFDSNGLPNSTASSPPKGNIQQNISRASVVSFANGRGIAMIELDSQPRVEIQLRIVSVDRNATEQLGIDWRVDGPNVSVGSVTGGLVPLLPAPANATGSFGGDNGDSAVDLGNANIAAFLTPGKYSISAFLQAIQGKGAASALSEPLLTAVSGESVSFLVGGEIPIPGTSTGITTNSAIGGTTTTTQTTIVFREFGIQLLLRPTVLDSGRISLILDQYITQPDFGNAVTLGGNAVPGFAKRAVRTVTESYDNETWALAGLITEEDSERLQSVPWISQVPIIGELFKKKDKRKTRSELILTVTARRVADPESVQKADAAGGKP